MLVAGEKCQHHWHSNRRVSFESVRSSQKNRHWPQRLKCDPKRSPDNLKTPHFFYHLLEESITNKLQVKESILTMKK